MLQTDDWRWLIAHSKDRERIHRRPRASLHRERRKRDHEFVASQPSCCFDGMLEVEILHNVYAHPLHDHLMNWVAGNALGCTPAGPRIPVDIEVMTEKRRLPLLNPWKRIREIARYLPRPRPGFRAALPSADVQQDNITRSGFYANLLLPRFEIRASDRCSRLDPFHSLQLRNVVKDRSRDNAVPPRH